MLRMVLRLTVLSGMSPSYSNIGTQDPDNPKSKWQKSHDHHFATGCQTSLEFEVQSLFCGSSLTLGEVDQEEEGADNQGEVGRD